MSAGPMEDFESLLGRSRLESLAESAHDSDRRLLQLEETIQELRQEIVELKAESQLAFEARLIALERMARI